jgi:multidrug resistance efflux pump
MLIIMTLYVVLVWLLLSKLQRSDWGWFSGSVVVLIGAFILVTFLAFFNFLTPSGQFVIASRVVEVMPNVTGKVVATPVKPNVGCFD